MNNKPNIVQRFHSTQCYRCMRGAVVRTAAWTMDRAIEAFFLGLGLTLAALLVSFIGLILMGIAYCVSLLA